jgi:hypothetical protein
MGGAPVRGAPHSVNGDFVLRSVGDAAVDVPAEMVTGWATGRAPVVRYAKSAVIAVEPVTAIIPGQSAGGKRRRQHGSG